MKDSSNTTLFSQLYKEYFNPFTRFAHSYVKDSCLAEDIVMESFMAYWENQKKLNPGSNIPAYILTTVKNKCLNHLQQLKVENKALNRLKENNIWELEMRISSLQECNANELLCNEIKHIIQQTLLQLPKQTRKIFEMSRFQNKSHKEIAEIYKLTTKGIEFHINKTLKILRIRLREYFTNFIL